MRAEILIGLLISLMSQQCAAKDTKAERQARWTAMEGPFVQCQMAEIEARDDGMMPVETLALVVLAQCRQEGIEWLHSIMPDADPIDMFDRYVSPAGVDRVSWRILDHRTDRRSEPIP